MSNSMFKFTLLFACSLAVTSSFACTTVLWNTNNKAKVVARSMDLYVSDTPQIVVLPREMERNGEAGENSLQWKSKYGSVVVTAFNTNTVSDGMNEKGLGVHLLYLDDTKYPQRDTKIPAISNVIWAQYFLDNFTTVSDAIKAANTFQVTSSMVNGREWPIHLTMEDATGDSAVIEYLNGQLKIHHGPQYTVMTNEPAYDIQLANLKRYKLFGGKLPLPGDSDPLSRFVRVATYLKTLPAPNNVLDTLAGTLSVIRTAAVPFGAEDTSGNKTSDAWPTRWITLSDLTNKIYYFNSTTTPNIVWLDLNDLNFAPNSPVLTIDPNNIQLIGDISKNLTEKKM